MDITTIFLLIIFTALGAAVGAILQRAHDRQPVPPPVPPAAFVSPDDNILASEGDVEILRAWRTLSGRIWLEMDRERLNGKESFQPDQRRRLVSLLLDLRPWLDNTPATAVVSEVQPILPNTAVPPGETMNVDQKEVKPVPVFKSIVQQIDDILQANFLLGPFKDRNIHLVEGPNGLVYINDGLNKYEGIDAVPDTELKALIRQAVADWEKSSH